MRRLQITGALVAGLAMLLPSSAHAQDYSTLAQRAWKPNGAVYSMAVTDTRVYLGGSFTALVNSVTGQRITRSRLAAVDRVTGAPIVDWAPTADNTVYALTVSPSGRVYAGGDFLNVNGTPAERVVALDATGASVAGWTPSPDDGVRGLALNGGSVYVAGNFRRIDGLLRVGVAKVDATSGTVDAGFDAGVRGGRVSTVQVVEGDAYLGGNFSQLGSESRGFVGSVDADTGAVQGWAPAALCETCRIFDLMVSGEQVYGALGGEGGGRAVAWSRATGAVAWQYHADGDVQAVDVHDEVVYFGGHFAQNFGRWARKQLAAVSVATGGVLGYRLPAVWPYKPGVWTVDAADDALRLGGGTVLDGQEQRRYLVMPPLVRTTVTVNLFGCDKGCRIRLAQAHSDRKEVWASPWRWATGGRKAFVIPSERTRGLSVQIRAPWERRLRGTTEVVVRYAGQAPGSQVSARKASRHTKGTSCLAGTRGSAYNLGVKVRKAKVWGTKGLTTGTRAWTPVTQRYWKPIRKAPKGVLQSKDVTDCVEPG